MLRNTLKALPASPHVPRLAAQAEAPIIGPNHRELEKRLPLLSDRDPSSQLAATEGAELLRRLFPEFGDSGPVIRLFRQIEPWADFINGSNPPTIVIATGAFAQAGKAGFLDTLAAHLALAGERFRLRQEFGDNASVIERSGTLHEHAMKRLAVAGFSATALRNLLLDQPWEDAESFLEKQSHAVGAHSLGRGALVSVEAVMIELEPELGCSPDIAGRERVPEWVMRVAADASISPVQRVINTPAFFTGTPEDRVSILIEVLNDDSIRWSADQVTAVTEALLSIDGNPTIDGDATLEGSIETSLRKAEVCDQLRADPVVPELFQAIRRLGARGEHAACGEIFAVAAEVLCESLEINPVFGGDLCDLAAALTDVVGAASQPEFLAAAKRVKSAMARCPEVTHPDSRLRTVLKWSCYPTPANAEAAPPWSLAVACVNHGNPQNRRLVRELIEAMGIYDPRLYENEPSAWVDLVVSDADGVMRGRLPGPVLDQLGGASVLDWEPSIAEIMAGDLDILVADYVGTLVKKKSSRIDSETQRLLSRGPVRSACSQAAAETGYPTLTADLIARKPRAVILMHAEVIMEVDFQEALVKQLINLEQSGRGAAVRIFAGCLLSALQNELGERSFRPFDDDDAGAPFAKYLMEGCESLDPSTRWELLRRSECLPQGVAVSQERIELVEQTARSLRPLMGELAEVDLGESPLGWKELIHVAEKLHAAGVPDIHVYLALEVRVLVDGTSGQIPIMDLGRVLARFGDGAQVVSKLIDPSRISLQGVDVQHGPIRDVAAAIGLMVEFQLVDSWNDFLAGLEVLTERIASEPQARMRRELVELLLFTTSDSIQSREHLSRLFAISAKSFLRTQVGPGKKLGSSEAFVAPEKAVVEYARRIGDQAHPRYVTEWLNTLGRTCEVQATGTPILRRIANLSAAKTSLADPDFDQKVDLFKRAAEKIPNIHRALAYFLLLPASAESLGRFVSSVNENEDFQDENSGSQKSGPVFQNAAALRRFAERLHTSFWWDSSRGLTGRILDLLLPVGRTDDEGRVRGGALGRSEKDLSALAGIALDYSRVLHPDYEGALRPALGVWLNDGSPFERLVRLVNFIVAGQAVMQGARAAGSTLAALAERNGPYTVFALQRGPTEFAHLPPLRSKLAAVNIRTKSLVAIPEHWDAVMSVVETLPPEELAKIAHVQGVIGCGKIWISIGCVLHDGSLSVVQIQRRHCGSSIAAGERRVSSWLNKLRRQPGAEILERIFKGGGEACQTEIDISLSQAQFAAAERRMDGRRLVIRRGSDSWTFDTATPRELGSGIGVNGLPYRHMTRLPGEPFVRWSSTAPEADVWSASAAAYAFGALQIARGVPNRDPHEGNTLVEPDLKISGLGLIDFGLLELRQVNREQHNAFINKASDAFRASRDLVMSLARSAVGMKYPMGDSMVMSAGGLEGFGFFLTPQERLAGWERAVEIARNPIRAAGRPSADDRSIRERFEFRF